MTAMEFKISAAVQGSIYPSGSCDRTGAGSGWIR